MPEPKAPRGGLLPILVATGVAGVLGYVIQLLAASRLRDAGDYVAFSVFWSALYLAVTALSGIQQEVTRASRPTDGGPRSTTLRNFTLVALGLVFIVLVAMTAVGGGLIFPANTWAFAGMLTLGLAGYVLTASLAGVLYGLHMWRAIAALTIVDALARAALVVTGLLMGLDAVWIAGFVAVPFILAFGVVWLATRERVVGGFLLDVGWQRLSTNTLRTVIAAAATGVMITGLPLLLSLAFADMDSAVLAGVILAITITRAPFIVPLMALQSYLITVFRGSSRSLARPLLVGLAAGGVVTVMTAAVGWLIGPAIVSFVSAGRYDVSSPLMSAVVGSACLVALLAVTGPALLSRARHSWYAAGWVLAAVLTVVLLFLPLPLAREYRFALALLIPPVVGISLHLCGFVPRAPRPAPAIG